MLELTTLCLLIWQYVCVSTVCVHSVCVHSVCVYMHSVCVHSACVCARGVTLGVSMHAHVFILLH